MRALLLSVAAASGLWWWGQSGAGIEAIYARGIFPWVGGALQTLTGWVPFSVFEVGVFSLLGSLAFGLWRARGWRGYGRLLIRCATVTALGYVVFLVSWGLNYGRDRLQDQQSWDTGAITEGEIKAAAVRELRRVQDTWAALPPEIATDEGSRLPYPAAEIVPKVDAGYRALGWLDYAPAREWQSAPAKPIWLLFRPGMTAGMYSPWTAEANYGFDLPEAGLPFTIAHEVAHVRGFAREDECNLLAVAATRASPDPYVRYSGAWKGFLYMLRALRQVDSELAQSLREQLPAGVKADIQATNDYWAEKPQNLMQISGHIYDHYLKSQGVAAGRRSYSMMVRLVIYLGRDEARRAEMAGAEGAPAP